MRALAFFLRAARRLGGFTASVLLLAVASLVLMPATIAAAGLEVWSSVVLGQALALVVQTLAGCGYGINGPAVIATQSLGEGVGYFRLAQRTRLVVGAPSFVLMALALFTIPNPDPLAGLLGGGHLAIGSFSALFFFVGRGAPLWLLVAETLPRVVSMVAGAIALVAGAPLLIGLSLPVVGAAIAVAISNFTIYRSIGSPDIRLHYDSATIRRELKNQSSAIAAALLRGSRDALPVLIITVVAPNLVGAFGVFDRIQRQAIGALAPVTSTLQGWVPRRIATDGNLRAPVAAALAGFVGSAIVFCGLAACGSTIIRYLSAGELQPYTPEVLLFAAVIATTMLVQLVTYACLVPTAGVVGVIWSSVVGIAAIAILVPVMVLSGDTVASALAAITLANVVQLLAQLFVFFYYLKKGRFK